MKFQRNFCEFLYCSLYLWKTRTNEIFFSRYFFTNRYITHGWICSFVNNIVTRNILRKYKMQFPWTRKLYLNIYRFETKHLFLTNLVILPEITKILLLLMIHETPCIFYLRTRDFCALGQYYVYYYRRSDEWQYVTLTKWLYFVKLRNSIIFNMAAT